MWRLRSPGFIWGGKRSNVFEVERQGILNISLAFDSAHYAIRNCTCWTWTHDHPVECQLQQVVLFIATTNLLNVRANPKHV